MDGTNLPGFLPYSGAGITGGADYFLLQCNYFFAL
jgi:hypothetical protein